MESFAEYRSSLSGDAPPITLPPLLKALWWDGRGDWARAHEIAQDELGPDAAWVHAYLHRTEGDAGNAAYWYRQAGKPMCSSNLQDEWQQIVKHLLAREHK
jgi:hypothetical protein